MATQVADHATLTCFLNGSRLVTPNSIQWEYESGQIEVVTLEGLAGFTPGPGMATITISGAVPIGGLEINFTKLSHDGTYCEFQIPVGGESYIGNGKILNVSVSQSTSGSTEYNFSWKGQAEPLS